MKQAAIIGAGPAGLMAAEELCAAGLRVTVYDRMPSLGRKFLLAGRGGLNLTHSEPLEPFLSATARRAEACVPRSPRFRPMPCGLGRRAGTGNIRRQQRTCVSEGDEGLAPAARLAAPPRRRAYVSPAPSLAGLDGNGRCVRDADGRSDRAPPTSPCSPSAAPAGHSSARTAAGSTPDARAASRSRR